MPHPLSRPPSALRPPSSVPRYDGDGTTKSVAEWARLVPVKETVLHEGQSIDVYNLRQRIVILSPSYGFQVTEFYLSAYVACLGVTAHYRLPDGSIARLPVVADRLNVPNDSHIDRARNTIANIWYDQDLFDLGYWWDVDIPLHPEFLWLIFQHLTSGKQFVCGHYAMKDIVPTFVANVFAPPEPGSELHELMDGGTGSMGWHRDVLTKLRTHAEVKPYICAPNSPFPGQTHYAYFSSGPYGPKDPASGNPQWLSEDWKVCRLWQELGGKVYGDRRIKLQHFGGLLYPPTVESLTRATQAMIRGNHPAVQADALRAALANYKEQGAGSKEQEKKAA